MSEIKWGNFAWADMVFIGDTLFIRTPVRWEMPTPGSVFTIPPDDIFIRNLKPGTPMKWTCDGVIYACATITEVTDDGGFTYRIDG